MSAGAALTVAGCRHRARWARGLQTWDLRLAGGDIELLEAPNGAGKSTFLRAIVGLQPAAWRTYRRSGAVRFVGPSAGPSPLLRVEEHLALLAARTGIDSDALDRATERWQVDHLRRRFGDGLSAGERRAVAVALALAPRRGPDVIVLDEPTLALDEARRALLDDELLAAAGRGSVLVLADHDPGLRRRFGRSGSEAAP